MNKQEQEEFIRNLMQSPRVTELRKRAKRCKCKYCGSELRLKLIIYDDTIDPRIEIFCNHCDRIEYGVEPEIYNMAKYFVDEIGFDHYPEMDNNLTKERMNVAKICEIIFWAFKGVDYLDMDGFKYPVNMDKHLIGESVVLDLEALDDQEGDGVNGTV